MIKPILIAPHPALRQKSQPADPSDPQVSQLIKDLIETLTASKIPGVGLSAPQIGVNQRVFVARLDGEETRGLKVEGRNKNGGSKAEKDNQPSALHLPTSNFKIFINPKILWQSDQTNVEAQASDNLYLEGCLSIPNIYTLIKRPHQIKLSWQSPQSPTLPAQAGLNSQSFEHKFQGFSATLIQHEIDHLNGVLFTDLAIKQDAPIYQDKKGGLEEVVI